MSRSPIGEILKQKKKKNVVNIPYFQKYVYALLASRAENPA